MSSWKALRNDMNQGPAAQWVYRLRRRSEHPNYKTCTEPSYVEIEKLVAEVQKYRKALQECWGECVTLRWQKKEMALKLRQIIRKAERVNQWLQKEGGK